MLGAYAWLQTRKSPRYRSTRPTAGLDGCGGRARLGSLPGGDVPETFFRRSWWRLPDAVQPATRAFFTRPPFAKPRPRTTNCYWPLLNGFVSCCSTVPVVLTFVFFVGLAAHHCSRFSAFFISGADALFLFLSNQPPTDPATIYLIASAAVLVLFDPPTSFSTWSLLRLWYPNSARLQPNRSQIDAALVTVSTRETRRGRFLKVLEVTIRKKRISFKGT